MNKFDLSLEGLGVDAKAHILAVIKTATEGGDETGAVIAQPYIEDGLLRLRGFALVGDDVRNVQSGIKAAKNRSNNNETGEKSHVCSQ
jgi:hypothetical protein